MDLKKLSDKELLALRDKTQDDIVRYDIIQKTRKIQLNSAYGALGTPYFRYFDVDIAESVTLSGRLVYAWMAREINTKMNNILKTSNVDYIVASDTDSVAGDTVINVNGNDITISEFFNTCNSPYVKSDSINKDFVRDCSQNTFTTPSLSDTGQIEHNKISYVMKHRVKKRHFKISVGEKSVVVTEDHSVIVRRKEDEKIVSIKPEEINQNAHEVITIV